MSREEAELLDFERHWDPWVKTNEAAWNLDKMHKVSTIRTVAHMWNLVNCIPDGYVGRCSVFIMRDGIKPLWEANGDLLTKGGCWSCVVRNCAWRAVLAAVVADLCGETRFGDGVCGACFVLTNTRHIICKLWCTSDDKQHGTALTQALAALGSLGAPRFKSFT